jgi:hypothetical protein
MVTGPNRTVKLKIEIAPPNPPSPIIPDSQIVADFLAGWASDPITANYPTPTVTVE